jgi:ribonuclease HI
VISVYSDGSSSGRSDRPGGWSWIILVDGEPFKMDAGGDPSTTNNRMELKGALEGLRYLKERSRLDLSVHRVELVSDSEYTLGIAAGSYTPTANLDLAEPLRHLAKELGLRARWVKGHDKEQWNERCDYFAKAEKKKLERQSAGHPTPA